MLQQFVSKVFLDPMRDLRMAIDETARLLNYHAPTIFTPISRTPARSDAARDALMDSSASLISKLSAIPFYAGSRWLYLGRLPAKRAISEAAVLLRGLSTHMHEEGEKAVKSIDAIHNRVDKIRRLLKIDAG